MKSVNSFFGSFLFQLGLVDQPNVPNVRQPTPVLTSPLEKTEVIGSRVLRERQPEALSTAPTFPRGKKTKQSWESRTSSKRAKKENEVFKAPEEPTQLEKDLSAGKINLESEMDRQFLSDSEDSDQIDSDGTRDSQSSSTEKESTSLEDEEQAAFFTHQEPTKWYSLKRQQGKIRLVLPSDLRLGKRLIYIFRNRKKECVLIGKTGGSLNKRMPGYMALFNQEGSEFKAKKEGRRTFLMDVKKNPSHFEIGILHILKPQEDLDLFETLFIKYQSRRYTLYNDNRGGGGGMSHSDEVSTTYAIPKPNTGLFTPVKYYPYQRNTQGDICPVLTPTFKKIKTDIQQDLGETQEMLYVIKEVDTERRYVGATGVDPAIRSRQHGAAAEYHDPEHEKYDPLHKDGALHPALGREPEKFEFGLFPLKSIESIAPQEREKYVTLGGIAEVERYVIQMKQSHVSHNGFNCNLGGGGPIARRAAGVKRALNFEPTD